MEVCGVCALPFDQCGHPRGLTKAPSLQDYLKRGLR